MHRIKFLVPLAVFIMLSCKLKMPDEVAVAFTDLPEQVDFNFHIKPILSDRCYACHGPDENTRQAGLRLDLEDGAFSKLASGQHAFVPGKPARSEGIRRILSDDPEIQMPPPDAHLELTPKEKALIIKWVDQGAEWKQHWAFLKPEKTIPKNLEGDAWKANNQIDLFIQQKLKEEEFTPAAEAEPERLLRRVSMDLTGLPPTIDEIASFLNDTNDNAYEKVVDRLLATDAYAERMALDWMDLSRYADSHGLHADGWRLMWPWRDWVIDAFNKNMPYDEFVTWQLAGDLLPEANKEQKLATAFNRNHPMTAEGGAIEEEFRLNYVWDRAETAGTAFLGLTMNCARCHDHKFDPVSQKEYYQFTAFFNNVKELGMTGDDGNYGPMLALPDEVTEKKLKALEKEIDLKQNQLLLTKKELADLNDFMEGMPNTTFSKSVAHQYPLDKIEQQGNDFIIDGNKKVSASKPPQIIKGKIDNAMVFTGEYDEIYLGDVPNFELTDAFSGALWMNTTKREKFKTQQLMGTSGEKNNFWRGWDFYLDSLNHLNARLIHSLPHNYLHVRSKDSVKVNQWQHVAFTYDGSGKAQGMALFIDGEPAATEMAFDNLYKSIKTVSSSSHKLIDRPVKVAKSYRSFTGEYGIFKGAIDDIQLFQKALAPLEVAALVNPEVLKNPPQNLAKGYIINQSPQITAINKTLKALRS